MIRPSWRNLEDIELLERESANEAEVNLALITPKKRRSRVLTLERGLLTRKGDRATEQHPEDGSVAFESPIEVLAILPMITMDFRDLSELGRQELNPADGLLPTARAHGRTVECQFESRIHKSFDKSQVFGVLECLSGKERTL